MYKVYCSNNLDEIIKKKVEQMNESGLRDPNYWVTYDVLDTVRDYLCHHIRPKHPHADEMVEYILRANKSVDNSEVQDCTDVVTTLMLQDEDGKDYLDAAYANMMKNNPTSVEDLIDDEKILGAIAMMADGFFDMRLSIEIPRPTEFVACIEDVDLYQVILTDEVDSFLEVGNVEEGDRYVIGRPEKDAPYILLSVYKKDGTEEQYPFIPLKRLREAANHNSFVQKLIPMENVNDFYREDLQE